MQPSLSIVTATYNAENYLPNLIDSLIAQTDPDFEWVVADGGSTDRTLELIDNAKSHLKRVIVDSQPDFGIYDALNRAVKLASGDYYVVVGADDTLFSETVANYKKACAETGADLITAPYLCGDQTIGIRQPAWEWLWGAQAYVTGHAVGLAVRRDLHNRVGEYSRYFPQSADYLFILEAIRQGATVAFRDFIAGRFYEYGTSGRNRLAAITEHYRIQVKLGHSLAVQTLLLLYRVIRGWAYIQKHR